MRKLVTVRRIENVKKHPNADLLDIVTIGGWQCITKRNEFKVNDPALYFELDSFLPESDFRFQFLMKNKITWQGKTGARLKTVKLRGQISQGLALPLLDFPEVYQVFNGIYQDQDFAELLGVDKWEPVIPAQLAGLMKGNFPSFIPKTDQERAQNIVDTIFDVNRDERYEITTKLEGSSMTIYYKDGEVGVCSRNLELKLEDDSNSFVRMAKDSGLIEALMQIGENIAIQGELMGPGIQGNHEGFKELRLYVYDIYDIQEGNYILPMDRIEILARMQDIGLKHVYHVPIEYLMVRLFDFQITDIQKLIDFADGPSINANLREGLVFKSMTRDFSFKIISNKYLVKHG